jgi:hypothetical protein
MQPGVNERMDKLGHEDWTARMMQATALLPADLRELVCCTLNSEHYEELLKKRPHEVPPGLRAERMNRSAD